MGIKTVMGVVRLQGSYNGVWHLRSARGEVITQSIPSRIEGDSIQIVAPDDRPKHNHNGC